MQEELEEKEDPWVNIVAIVCITLMVIGILSIIRFTWNFFQEKATENEAREQRIDDMEFTIACLNRKMGDGKVQPDSKVYCDRI